MTISTFSAAKRMAELSNWSVTNLQLQKLLYLAHMVYAGRKNARLIDRDFQAWDYGPVVPDLYHKAKIFGDKPIRNVFGWGCEDLPREEDALIEEIWSKFKNHTPSQLVSITHRPGGAWDGNYVPGARSIVIPFEDILAEYKTRNDQK